MRKGENTRQSNIKLNADDNNYFASTYGQEFQNRGGAKAELLGKNGRLDSVMIGANDDPNRFLSEAKSQFVPKEDGRAARLGPIKAGDSLVIGDGTGEYTTQYQDIHRDKFGDRQNSRLSQ